MERLIGPNNDLTPEMKLIIQRLVESMMTRSSSSANLARVATATSARFAELERQGGIVDSLSIIQRAFSLV